MKVWLFHGVNRPMEYVDLPDPIPAPGWVVLEVGAAGICHSDVSICDGPGGAWLGQVPIVLGHEVAGRVSVVGEGVARFSAGDRVGIGNGPRACDGGWTLPAIAARLPRDTISQPIQFAPGLGDNGGFAEKIAVPAHHLVSIPGDLPFPAAAVATDAIATAYRAVRTVGAARPGETVVIVGLGGLGSYGVQTARLCGASVYGVDLKPAPYEIAKVCGAIDCAESVAAFAQLKPDLIVDFAGMPGTFDAAVRHVRVNGRVVLVGLGSAHVEVSLYPLIGGEVQVNGSLGSTGRELADVYQLLAEGKLVAITQEVPFDALNEGIELLRRGAATGRLFVRPNGAI